MSGDDLGFHFIVCVTFYIIAGNKPRNKENGGKNWGKTSLRKYSRRIRFTAR